MKALYFSIIFILVNLALTSQSTWHIEGADIDPTNYYGVTVANGMIGLVSSPEPLKVRDVVLNGVYDEYQRGRVSNILKAFNHVNMTMDVDGQRVGMSTIRNYRQVLDMTKAELTTTFDVNSAASVTHRLMALRHLPYTALTVVEVVAHKDIVITPASVIEAPNHLTHVKNYYSQIDRPHIIIPLLSSVADSPSGKIQVAASNSFIFNEHHGEEPPIIHEDYDYNRHLAKFHKKLKAGERYSFCIVSSTISSVHADDPYNEAERLTLFAMLEGQDRLLSKHQEAWSKLWQSDIIIDGDDEVQRDVRFAMYHLYSFSRAGTAYSLSPMGLSGLGYNGHVFWDTEIWMYPPLLILQPEIAKSLLEYRFERLEAAKQNAFMHGYKGAMFPWESSLDGSEDTPIWALTGPFQQHITGCVAWAFWKYYQVTGDKSWLRERGWPVIEASAEFWLSKAEKNDQGGHDINNVIGANEFQENIDNNAFTNGMAKTVLAYAHQAANVLNIKSNPAWMDLASKLPILTFEDGTTKENTTYQGEIIKQVDVNLLSYPLDIITDQAQIKKDLDYYLPRLSPGGPAMGPAIMSVLYNRLGLKEDSEKLFTQSYLPNKVPPFGVLAETAGGTNPYFATGAGGMLQAVMMGFGGLKITDDGVVQIESIIPTGWQSLTIKGVGINEKEFTVKNSNR